MFTIGKLANRVNVSADTVRYYEKEGLLRPKSRSEAGYRLYGPDAIRRLLFIKQAQQCGFSLAEVRELLDLQDNNNACCDDIRHRAITKKLQLEHKIRALAAMSASLTELIKACEPQTDKPLTECPILAAMEAGLVAPAAHQDEP